MIHNLKLAVACGLAVVVGLLVAPDSTQAADVLVGPGSGVSSTGADTGDRLNIDTPNPSPVLGPGIYNVSDFSYFSTSAGGSVTPFLAQQRSDNSYTTLWVGGGVTPGATGVQGATYAPGTEQFTLVDSAPVFAGHFMSGGRVAFTGGGQTDHDNSFTAPATPGNVIGGFSNANLVRTYAFGVNVDDVSATSAAGLSPVAGLFNTGVDAGGTVIAPGGNDPHWTITSSPGGFIGPAVVQANHPAWLANDSFSSWISTVPAGTTNIQAGDYVFETTFDLSGLDTTMTELVLNIAADNSFDVELNGNPTGLTGGGFGAFTGPLSITSGFEQGLNTLEITLNNAGPGDNPGGLRVELAAFSTAVPEPTSIALWSLLGLGLGWFGYRRVKNRK